MDDSIKFFTVDEANSALPLVRKVVEDIIDSYSEWCDRVEKFDLEGCTARTVDQQKHSEARAAVEEVAGRINGYIAELHQIGCVLKGFDDGLVDFHSMLDGKHVFLCWKFGEECVSHWHELDGGYAGRQPLTPELVERNGSAP